MAHNLHQCQILVRKAVAAGAKALFLPEAADYMASSPAESLALVRPVADSVFVRGLRDAARRERLPIHVGVHEPTTGDGAGRIKNTVLWIDEAGDIAHRYQKIHLFDVDIAGGPVLKESAAVEAGSVIEAPFETGVGKVGMAICFDVRISPPLVTRLPT